MAAGDQHSKLCGCIAGEISIGWQVGYKFSPTTIAPSVTFTKRPIDRHIPFLVYGVPFTYSFAPEIMLTLEDRLLASLEATATIMFKMPLAVSAGYKADTGDFPHDMQCLTLVCFVLCSGANPGRSQP